MENKLKITTERLINLEQFMKYKRKKLRTEEKETLQAAEKLLI